MRRRSQLALVVVGVAAVLVAARLVAPYAVERYANRQLADLGDYRGSVSDVDLFLWRGGYALRNLEIVKVAATRGANDTTTLSLLAHQELTGNRLIGYGSALSVLTFVIVMAVSFAYIRAVGGNIRALVSEK